MKQQQVFVLKLEGAGGTTIYALNHLLSEGWRVVLATPFAITGANGFASALVVLEKD